MVVSVKLPSTVIEKILVELIPLIVGEYTPDPSMVRFLEIAGSTEDKVMV